MHFAFSDFFCRTLRFLTFPGERERGTERERGGGREGEMSDIVGKRIAVEGWAYGVLTLTVELSTWRKLANRECPRALFVQGAANSELEQTRGIRLLTKHRDALARC